MNKKIMVGLLLCSMMFGTCGCKKQVESPRVSVDFVVCDRTKIPDELWKLMEERKEKGYELSFKNQQNLYIAIGYGAHDRQNLCVVVENLYRTNRGIYVKTRLSTTEMVGEDGTYENMMIEDKICENMTPTDNYVVGEESMYPYIVLKCNQYDLPVIYEE